MRMRSSLPILLALAAGPALAHPGHGHGEGGSLLHFLSAPEHAWPLGLLAVAVIAGLFVIRRHRQRTRR